MTYPLLHIFQAALLSAYADEVVLVRVRMVTKDGIKKYYNVMDLVKEE